MARTNKKLSPKKLSPQKKKTATNGKVIKRRRKPGSLVTREIKFYQNNTNLLIRKLPFARLVREILKEMLPFREPFRWQTNAMEALQEAAEGYLITLFEHCFIVAANAKRCTIMLRDMQTVRRIRGYDDLANR